MRRRTLGEPQADAAAKRHFHQAVAQNRDDNRQQDIEREGNEGEGRSTA